MGARKKAAGAAALSAVALATLMGAQPAAAEDTSLIDCDLVITCPGGDFFGKWTEPGRTSAVFSKIEDVGPAVAFQKVFHKFDGLLLGAVDDAFLKYDAYQKFDIG